MFRDNEIKEIDLNDFAVDEVIKKDLHPEAYHLLRLGEEYHNESIIGSINFHPPKIKKKNIKTIHRRSETITSRSKETKSFNLQSDTFSAQSVRDKITKKIYFKIKDLTKKRGYRDKDHHISFYIAFEKRNGIVHAHFIFFKDGFKKWIPNQMAKIIKESIKDFTHSKITYVRLFKKGIGDFTSYIHKKENCYDINSKSYETFEGKRFFSHGLKLKLKKID